MSEQVGFEEEDVRTLFVVWSRGGGKFEAKPFTGNESWDDPQDPSCYGEEHALVAAKSKADAERLFASRAALKFPQIFVQR